MSLYTTLLATVPVSALRVESLLHLKSHRLIDTLFVCALIILPITTFLVVAFWLVATTGMTGEADAGGLVLPP